MVRSFSGSEVRRESAEAKVPVVFAAGSLAAGRSRIRGVLLVWLLSLLALLAPLVWGEGIQTGVVVGTVFDIDGVEIQGVEVELVGAQGSRRAVTDEQGRFRFPALGVGSYGLRADLLELMAERRGVAVFAGRTTEVDLVLQAAEGEAPPLEDWIQVLGEAPLIDRYETRVGANLGFDFLDDLPAERFYQSFALLLPGVAGGEDGNPNTSGALRSANLFLVDGVDTSDPTTGLFGLNLSYEAVLEVQVTTAAAGVEYGRGSGAVINVVTKSGGRQLAGHVRWEVAGDDFASDYLSTPDRANLEPEITAANSGRSDLDHTLSLSLGGPLVRDKLWFFGAYQDAALGLLRPTLVDGPWDSSSEILADALKLTWQPASQQTVVAQRTGDETRFSSFQPFSRGPSELQLPDVPGSGDLGNSFFQDIPGEAFALERRRQRGSFAKVQWNAAFGQNHSLGLTLADQTRRLSRDPLRTRGLTADAPHVGAFLDPAALPGDENAGLFLFLFNGVTEEGFESRPRQQGNLAIDAFRRWAGVEHEWRFGIDFQETHSELGIEVPGADGFDSLTGRPTSGQLFIDFDRSAPCLVLQICAPFDPATGEFQPVGLFNFYRRSPRSTREESLALYLSDTLVLDRWLLYLGLRWESVEAENGDGVGLVDDRDLALRLGVTYDLGRQRKTVLTFSAGRFYESFLHQYLDAYQRLEPLSGFTEYERRDHVGGLDCLGVDPADFQSPCWRPTEVVPEVALLPALPNRGIERSAVDEWTLGAERQLGQNSSLGVVWIDRDWRDLWNGVLQFLPQEDLVVAEARNLPEARRSYRALQGLFRKRLANRWQLLASVTWSDAEGNFFSDDGLDTFDNFGDLVDLNRVNRLGPAPYDRPYQIGVFGSYHQPFGQAFLTLGSALQYRDGTPFQLEALEEAGIRFLTLRGSQRLSGVWQWDLAATLELELGSRLHLELRAEVRNLTDEQQVTHVESLLDTGQAGFPPSLEGLQTPRTFGLTIGLGL